MDTKKEISNSKIALRIAQFASDKQAKDITVLDVSEISSLCDYFIICSGESAAQVRAICDNVQRLSRKEKIRISFLEKDKESHWILIDFFDVILHIFIEEAREFYNLEYLWKESKKIKFSPK